MKHAVLALSALLGLASAGAIHEHRGIHAQLHELKRDAAPTDANETCTTGCVSCTTIYTTWYGEPTLVAAPAPAPTTSETPAPAAPTSTYVPPPSSAAPAPSQAPSAPENKGQSSPASANPNSGSSSSSSGSGSGTSSGKISTGGSLYAMSYTPYKNENGASRCASAQEVSSDIAKIASKGFKTVRAYATDCDGLVHIGNACKAAGMKMIVGIYVDKTGVSSEEVGNQVHDIKTYFNGDYSIVEMVLFGNEVLFNNFASASQLAGAISSLRKELRSAGYKGPVSTADTVADLQEHEAALCDNLDILAANIHPFFNDAVSAATAGSFVATQLSMLKSLCGGSKQAINSETGWPSGGDSNGAALPNQAAQLVAIESIKHMVGGESVFFSFEDDHWKDGGFKGVEKHWGCANVFSG